MTESRPVIVRIDFAGTDLSPGAVRHVFQELLVFAGFSWRFVSAGVDGPVDIHHGEQPCGRCRLFFRSETGAPADLPKKGEPVLSAADLIRLLHGLLAGIQDEGIETDPYDRPRIEQSTLYRADRVLSPLFNEVGLELREFLSKDRSPVPLWPEGKRFAFASTHDVDHPQISRLADSLRVLLKRRQRASPRTLLRTLLGRESFWCFEEWRALERPLEIQSAFYFAGFQGSLLRYLMKAPDPLYDIRDKIFSDAIRQLREEGCEIGLHASFEAYRSVEQFQKEKARVEEASGAELVGNRHHYWHLSPTDPIDTLLLHEQVGLIYDTSIAFAKHVGFRWGVASPFHPYHRGEDRPIRTLQLPTGLMDDHLFSYLSHSRFSNWREAIDAVVDGVARVGGVLVADYHVRVLNASYFPEWGESARALTAKVAERSDVWLATPERIARHWLARKLRLEEASRDETGRADESG